MDKFGRCVVKSSQQKTKLGILGDDARSEIIRAIRDYLPDCVPMTPRVISSMQFEGDLIRYALADALVARLVPAQLKTDFENIPRLSHRSFDNLISKDPKPSTKDLNDPVFLAARERARVNGRLAYALDLFGECVVRSAPVESRDLVRTEVESTDEGSRFDKLTPLLGECLPAGQQLILTRTLVRGAVAVNYYRLVMSPAASVGAAK